MHVTLGFTGSPTGVSGGGEAFSGLLGWKMSDVKLILYGMLLCEVILVICSHRTNC